MLNGPISKSNFTDTINSTGTVIKKIHINELTTAISKLELIKGNVDNCGNCAPSDCCQSCQSVTCQACQTASCQSCQTTSCQLYYNHYNCNYNCNCDCGSDSDGS